MSAVGGCNDSAGRCLIAPGLRSGREEIREKNEDKQPVNKKPADSWKQNAFCAVSGYPEERGET